MLVNRLPGVVLDPYLRYLLAFSPVWKVEGMSWGDGSLIRKVCVYLTKINMYVHLIWKELISKRVRE